METIKQQLSIPSFLSALCGLTVYLNTINNEFCFDDYSAIMKNPDLRSNVPWTNLIWNDFWGTPIHQEGSHKSYRPLTVATFRINYMLHELDPRGYHFVNILLHAIVCYIFVLVCSKILFKGWTHSHVPLLVAGLTFAVHPIHTEAVAGLVGRAECLSSIFFLLSFMAYKKSIESKTFIIYSIWLLSCILLCICSVLSKEQGVTVLAVCLCYDYFIYHKNSFHSSLQLLCTMSTCGKVPSWFKSFILRTIVLVGFLIAIMILRVKIMQAELPVFTIHDNPAVNEPTPYRQLHWLYLIFQNVWLLINPSFLCADWTMNTIPLIQSITDIRNILTLITFLALFSLGVYSINNTRPYQQGVLFGLLILVFPFLPASNLLFPVGFVVAERILYIPSMGYSILLAIGCHKLMCTHSNLIRLCVKIGVCFLLIIHTSKTLDRNRDWSNNIQLFSSAIKINSNNGKLYSNLGHEHEGLGNYSYAEELYRTAVNIQSDDIGAFNNLGRILKVQNKTTEAEKAYRTAIELMPKGTKIRVAPNHINVYFNLANLLKDNPLYYQEAFFLYKKAVSMKPSFYEAHLNMGDLLLKMNKTEEAKYSFLKAVESNREYSDAHFNLGTTYIRIGRDDLAEASYRKALAIDPKHSLSMFNLGMMLYDKKDTNSMIEAKKWFIKLTILDPTDEKVHFQLGMLCTDLQDFVSAKKWFKSAVDIVPSYRSALYNLGFLYYKESQFQEALEYLLLLREFHPNHVKGMQILGDSLIYLKRYTEAKEAYLLCLKTDPNHVVATHNLGVTMTELGDFVEAERLFRKTLELDPQHKAAAKHLQGAQAKLAQLHRKKN